MTANVPLYNLRGKRICGAKRRDGGQCQAPATENGRCRKHGGLTPSGVNAPSFKHGRYSKQLPTRLWDAYQEAITDEQLLALNEGIATLDARLVDLFSRADDSGGLQAWRQLKHQLNQLRTALLGQRVDLAAAMVAMNEMTDVVNAGIAEASLWQDVLFTIEQRRKMTETEMKRRKEMENLLTAEQAVVFVHAVVDSVRRRVDDPDTIAQIEGDFRRLLVGTGR